MKTIEIEKSLPNELTDAIREVLTEKERDYVAMSLGQISPSTLKNIICNNHKVKDSHIDTIKATVVEAMNKAKEVANREKKHAKLFNQYAA